MRIIKILFIVASVLCFTVSAGAQDYPAKPVKLIIPFTAGSATDFAGRTVAKKLSEMWGQPVEVENVAGAGGTIGADLVAKATADGYTLLEHSSAYAVSPALYKNLPYDPAKDFIAISSLASQPLALVVGTSSNLTSVTEVISQAKAHPGEMKFASPGIGSASHLSAEQFNIAAGIKVAHVPYKGGPETISAIKNGTATFAFLPLALAFKEGLKALAVTSPERSSALPDVPTIAETGPAGFESRVWWGIWAPAGIPDSIANKLEKDIAQALASPEVIEQFKSKKLDPMIMTSAEFKQFVPKEIEAVKNIVEQAGIEAQ